MIQLRRYVSGLLMTSVVLGLTGCAQAMWGKQGATEADVAQDVEQCQAELPKAEAIYQEAFASRGYTVALDRARDDPDAYAMYRANLMRLCLFSRGYRQVDMEHLIGIQRHVPLPPSASGLTE